MDGEEDTSDYPYVGTSHGSNHITTRDCLHALQLDDVLMVVRRPEFSFLIRYYNLLYQSLIPNCKLTIKILKQHLEIPSDVESFILNGKSSRIRCQRIINLLLAQLDTRRDYKQFCHLFNLISVMTDLTDKLRAEFHLSSDDVTQHHHGASHLTGSDVYCTPHTAHPSRLITTSNANWLDNCAQENVILRSVDDGTSDDRADNYSITSHHQVVGRRCRSNLVPEESVTSIEPDLTSDTTDSTDVSDILKAHAHFDNRLSRQLDKIVASLSPEDLKATLSTMVKIFDNIAQHPNDDKYRQIKLANKTFSNKVWRHHACEELMKMSGWVVEDDHVRLTDDSCVHTVLQLLETFTKMINTPKAFSTHSLNPTTCSTKISESDIVNQIIELYGLLNATDSENALKELNRIYQNVVQQAKDKPYQIKLTDKTFSNKVWRHPVCQRFMEMNGWIVEDDHVRLSDDSSAHFIVRVFKSIVDSDSKHPSDTTMVPTFSKQVSELIISCIFSENAESLKLILDSHSFVKEAYVEWVAAGPTPKCPLINIAFITKQIGIARILVNKYSVDPNSLTLGRLFSGCDSSEASQCLIIEFIKEFKFKLYDSCGSIIHYAVLLKFFTVLKFVVEDCKVDVNYCTSDAGYSEGATALHLAYALNEMEMVKYLIEHGANENLIDSTGRRPRDYQFNKNSRYHHMSVNLLKLAKLYRDITCKEFQYFCLMLKSGVKYMDAVHLTFEKFPELLNDVTHAQPCCNLETTPTMNVLNHYITDMAPDYYSIGLELGIHNRQLKVIKSDTSLPAIKQKCRAMLELWLDTDTSASWKKLCDALQEPEVGLCIIAEQMKKYLEAI